jgi:hypothetical protein
MSNTQKTYAKGIFPKTRTVAKIGEIINLSIKVYDLVQFLNQHKDSDGWIRLDMLPAREGSKWSHNVMLNDWKPTNTSSKPVDPLTQPIDTTKNLTPEEQNDLPF